MLGAERRQHPPSYDVGSVVELPALGEAPSSEDRSADSAVAAVDPNGDQTLLLEQAEEAADIAGVEPESASKIPHVGPVGADFPEQTRLTEWARESAVGRA